MCYTIFIVNYFSRMASHTITNPHLKSIMKQADAAYMDYLKKMKVLEKDIKEVLVAIEKKKAAAVRGKIKKLA